MSKENWKFTVDEAERADVAKGIARLDSAAMNSLGLTSGDIILIKGQKGKETLAKVWRSKPEDDNSNIIRIDATIRGNAGIGVGDEVEIKKAEVKDAKSIRISPLQEVQFASDPTQYLKAKLIDRPFRKNDKISFDIMGTTLHYVISNTNPQDNVLLRKNSQLVVSEKAVKSTDAIPSISYEDIGGLKEELAQVREMIELPLKHPELFERLGIGAPKGVLLTGPPGTGKTLLAKAVANESQANFYSIAGPEIISKFYGESEKHLREIFEQANKNAPSIIFIDEIDAIAPKRDEVSGEVERRVVAQLLTSMDGLESRGQVVVIAATNRPDSLDPALRRPGRFDREININVPDTKGRKEILEIHTRGMPLTKDVDLNKLAEMTLAYTGADLESLCKEAAMKALRTYLPKIKKFEEQKIPTELLETIEVNMPHFVDAFRKIEPSAMREVLIRKPNVKWSDIGGLEETKQKLIEAIEWPLKHPEDFKKAGIKPAKGILLYGPSGCGKTLLAKAVANESEANFISVKGPELISKWVGESEKHVREIFKKARQVSPSIIFFDEFDAISKMRGLSLSDATEKVVNQLLTELDGIEELEQVMVIAATNRPDLIDSALLRPGRIDMKIEVQMPDEKARLNIFKVHTKNMPLTKEVNIESFAKETEGFTGADIEGICREAGMDALRLHRYGKRENIEVTANEFKKIIKEAKKSKGISQNAKPDANSDENADPKLNYVK
ncbi:MAG: CDC48 family AAA ATPase [archaeon]